MECNYCKHLVDGGCDIHELVEEWWTTRAGIDDQCIAWEVGK